MDYSGRKKLAPDGITEISRGGVIRSKQSQFWLQNELHKYEATLM